MGNLIYYEIRFGIIGFGSVNHTEISVSVISVFTRFGRPLVDLGLLSDKILLRQDDK